jgi:hypothetical protein
MALKLAAISLKAPTMTFQGTEMRVETSSLTIKVTSLSL